jgi:hypothetical protein
VFPRRSERLDQPLDFALKALHSAQKALEAREQYLTKQRSAVLTTLNDTDGPILRHVIRTLLVGMVVTFLTLVLSVVNAVTFSTSSSLTNYRGFSAVYGGCFALRFLLLGRSLALYLLHMYECTQMLWYGVRLSPVRHRMYARSGVGIHMLELELRLCELQVRRLRVSIASCFLSDLPAFMLALYAVSMTAVYFDARFWSCGAGGARSLMSCTSAAAALAVLQAVIGLMTFSFKVRDVTLYVPRRLQIKALRSRLAQESVSFSALDWLHASAATTQEVSAAIAVRKVVLASSSLSQLCQGLNASTLDRWSLRALRACRDDSLEAALHLASWLRWRMDHGGPAARGDLVRGLVCWTEVPGVEAICAALNVSDGEVVDGDKLRVRVSPSTMRAATTCTTTAVPGDEPGHDEHELDSASECEEGLIGAATVTYLLEWLMCLADGLSEREQCMICSVELVITGFEDGTNSAVSLSSAASSGWATVLNDALSVFPLHVEVHVVACKSLASALRQLVPAALVLEQSAAATPSELASPPPPPPTTVPAAIGNRGSALDFFTDVSEHERATVALVLGFVRCLEERMLRHYYVGESLSTAAGGLLPLTELLMHAKDSLKSLARRPSISNVVDMKAGIDDLLTGAAEASQAALDLELRMAALGNASAGDVKTQQHALECTVFMAKILLRVGPLKSLAPDVAGCVQVLRVARRGSHDPFWVTSRFLSTILRRCERLRMRNINQLIKEGHVRLVADTVPSHADLIWPSLDSALSSPEPASLKHSKRSRMRVAPLPQLPSSSALGGSEASGMSGKSNMVRSGDPQEGADAREAFEAQKRFTRLAADVGMRPLLTLSQSAGKGARVGALLFDESAAAAVANPAALVAYWTVSGRLESALEWLFEYYAVMLETLSLKYGRVCYVQPFWRLDGSSPQLQRLVVRALEKMNAVNYPAVLHASPLVFVAGPGAPEIIVHLASTAHDISAPMLLLQLPEDADKAGSAIATAGLDPARLPRSLGGWLPEAAPGSLQAPPRLYELLQPEEHAPGS